MNKIIKIIVYALILFYNAVFVVSGFAKAYDFQRFVEILEKLYRGFPEVLYFLFAALFLCFEFMVAIGLWFKKTRQVACWAIVTVTWFFIMVHIRIMIFFPETNCNCYGALFDRPATWGTLFENIGIFTGAIIMLLLVRQQMNKRQCIKKTA